MPAKCSRRPGRANQRTLRYERDDKATSYIFTNVPHPLRSDPKTPKPEKIEFEFYCVRLPGWLTSTFSKNSETVIIAKKMATEPPYRPCDVCSSKNATSPWK